MTTERSNIMVEPRDSATLDVMGASLTFPDISPSGREELEPLIASLRMLSPLPWRLAKSIRVAAAQARALTKKTAQNTELVREWSRRLDSIPEEAAYQLALMADEAEDQDKALQDAANNALKLAHQPLGWLFGPTRELADAWGELRIANAKYSATLRAMLDRYDGSEHEAGLSEAARERLDKALRTPRSGRVMSFTQYADDA